MAAYDDTSNEKVKTRKIRKTDWLKVEEFVKKELAKRKASPFRTAKERIWTTVDRQLSMQPMKKLLPGGKEAPPSWESAIELGELSKASEVITADVMRLMFPQSRTWMETHVKPPMTVNPQTGKSMVAVDEEKQKKADGALRSLMVQQHVDFGLEAAVELSVKEALHHGGLVATCEWETQNKVYDGQGLETLAAPVWKPHSMWNCYPDMSPSVIPGAIFYPGSMLITSYMPRPEVLRLSGDGYMNISEQKITKKKNTNKDVETEDVELVTYYGDLNIDREDGNIYLPNSKCITANGTIIYYRANPLPFPEVIYAGYERQDVRDPYFTSPIEKNSPMQTVATVLTNVYLDMCRLHAQPSIVYDGNDAYMVQNGGLNIWPGAQTASKGSNKFEQIVIGDPAAALNGLQLALMKLEEGTSVNAIRSGARQSDRKTATEVQKTSQGAEVRTVDFVGKLEQQALRPFLYMQHELNLKRLDRYSFYCQEKGLPDFLTMSKKDLPKVVHFEVVGSKGVLGEERRAQQMTAVTAFLLGNPITAPLVNVVPVMIDMYEDAGVKGAESYVKTENKIPPQAQAQMQQMNQVIQELQQKLQEAESNVQAEMARIELDKQKTAEEIKLDRQKAAADHDLKVKELVDNYNLKLMELRAEMRLEAAKAHSADRRDSIVVQADMSKAASELTASLQGMATEQHQTLAKASKDIVDAAGRIAESAKAMASAKSGKVKAKRTADGFEFE